MTERPNGASASAPLDHITQPVLNRPHEEPSRYWQLTENNYSVLAEIRQELADANGDYNDGICRLAVRMAPQRSIQ